MPRNEVPDDEPTEIIIVMDIHGKCSEVIKTLVPFEVKKLFIERAHKAGKSESDYLRGLIYLDAIGEDELNRLHQQTYDCYRKKGTK